MDNWRLKFKLNLELRNPSLSIQMKSIKEDIDATLAKFRDFKRKYSL